MKNRTVQPIASLVAIAAAGLLASGCIEPPSDEEISTTTQAMDDDPDDPPFDDEPPPPPPPACKSRPGCWLRAKSYYSTSLQFQLGCTRSYDYYAGHTDPSPGGVGAFCPNTASVRNALRYHRILIYDAGYCTTCLKVPWNQVFAFFGGIYHGPGCSSGCADYDPPRYP